MTAAWIPARAYYEWYATRGIDCDQLREPVSLALKQAVIERDGLVCRLCGTDVVEDDLHIDHIFPVARGGRSQFDNLQVTHAKCNLSKGARVA